MKQHPLPAESGKSEDVRFQLSLLRLLYPNMAASPQVTALEGLLKPLLNLAPTQ